MLLSLRQKSIYLSLVLISDAHLHYANFFLSRHCISAPMHTCTFSSNVHTEMNTHHTITCKYGGGGGGEGLM